MAYLAKLSDLATVTKLPADSPKLTLALQRSTDRFIGECHHPVFRTTGELIVSGNGAGTLLLPAVNVSDITAVTVDGVAQAAGVYRLRRREGALVNVGGRWPRGSELVITCTHGYDPIPGDIADAVLEHAATIALALVHLQQESGGSSSASYNIAALSGTTQKWVDTVARHAVGKGDES